MTIKLIMLLAFFLVTISVGLYCRRHSTNVDGFVLGGRSVGAWLTAFAYGTSYFSAVIFVGYAGQFGWKFGVAATWIGVGNAIIGSLLAWVILGRRTRLMTHHFNSSTMPEFFGARFNSSSLRVIASVIVFVFLIPYTASLYNGLSRLFAMAFNINYVLCIIIMAALTAVYVVAGGYVATAINDFIQGIIMIGGIVAIVFAVLKTNGGLLGSIEALSMISDESVSANTGAFSSIFGPDPIGLLSVIILTSLGTWGLPQMVQKFYAIKNEASLAKGTIISTVFALIIAGGCYFLGGFGRLFSTNELVAQNGFDSIIPSMLSNFSPLLIGLTVILVLSASMSTLSSLVMASSSTLTLDFIDGIIIKDMKEKQKLLTIRVLVLVFVIISVIIAVFQYKQGLTFIAQLMGISWGALAGSFLAPYLFSLYWKRTTKVAVFASFAFACSMMILNMLFRSSFPTVLQSPINCGAFVMLSGLIIVPVVSLLTKKPDNELLEGAFASLKTKKVAN